MKNKFIERVYSAMELEQGEILDQIANDIEYTKQFSELKTEEYDMYFSEDSDKVLIHDKVNDEYTEAEDSPEGIRLEPKDKVECDKSFSKMRARHFLIDETGKVRAVGWEQILKKYIEKNPSWKLLSSKEFNELELNEKPKKFSEVSEDTKSFTRYYKLYAVLDKKGDLVKYLTYGNALNMVKENPGFTMVKPNQFRKSEQPTPVETKSRFKII